MIFSAKAINEETYRGIDNHHH